MTTGFEARKIVRSCRSGALATLDRNDQSPYVSFCATTFDIYGQPLFLLSDLADHTQNINVEPRVSFLCEQASTRSNPQSGPRVTLVGRVEKVRQDDLVARYLEIHPSAKMYAEFSDFNFYRLIVEKAHFVGGFGQAEWLQGKDYLGDSAVFLNFSKEQEDVISYLNTELPQLSTICATKLLKQPGEAWQLLRIDGDGMDLKRASWIIRYPFEKEVKTREELKKVVHDICS
ncbi:HugZ family protein [Terasakiella sp.]|uniref:HugZ family pyridoxamine 5'-phosphate oxidase n=1 Tax=Terasakiella sp. TaxID=2034861 RepID=UPI003AA91B3F